MIRLNPLVVPQIVAGRCADYARALRIERNWLTARGPVFRAIEGQRSEIFGISRWSTWGPWRKVAREHGVRSVIALRLSSTTDARRGLLVLYSDTEQLLQLSRCTASSARWPNCSAWCCRTRTGPSTA